MSKFGKLVGKIERKEPGLSQSSARKIAAAAGRKKLGSHEMAKRSAASRARHKGK